MWGPLGGFGVGVKVGKRGDWHSETAAVRIVCYSSPLESDAIKLTHTLS